jgi:hypothetical protein
MSEGMAMEPDESLLWMEQPIFDEGVAVGRLQEARALLVRLGRKRFGPPDPPTVAALDALPDVQQIERLTERLRSSISWNELLAARQLHGWDEVRAESTTYQAAFRKGLGKGVIEQAHRVLLQQAPNWLGEPEPRVVETLRSIVDLDRLERLCERAIDVNAWKELLADDHGPEEAVP